MRECMKPHVLIHTAFGVGLGMIVGSWMGAEAQVLGLVLAVVAVVNELFGSMRKKTVPPTGGSL